MKKKQQSVVLAGMLAIAVGVSGCAAMRGDWGGESQTGGSMSSGATQGSGGSAGTAGTDAPGTPGSSPAIPSDSGSAGSSGTSGTTGTTGTTGDPGMTGGSAQQGASQMGQGTGASMAPNSTVLSIEVMPAGTGEASAAGATGATGTAGATGAAQVYVITVQADDGRTHKITQEAVPDFRSGDRVNVTDGMIRR